MTMVMGTNCFTWAQSDVRWPRQHSYPGTMPVGVAGVWKRRTWCGLCRTRLIPVLGFLKGHQFSRKLFAGFCLGLFRVACVWVLPRLSLLVFWAFFCSLRCLWKGKPKESNGLDVKCMSFHTEQIAQWRHPTGGCPTNLNQDRVGGWFPQVDKPGRFGVKVSNGSQLKIWALRLKPRRLQGQTPLKYHNKTPQREIEE